MPEPLTLRQIAEDALTAKANLIVCDCLLCAHAWDVASEALFAALDAQEATLARQRELVEGWKVLAYHWATSISPHGCELDKAYTGCARELEDILDGDGKDGPQ